MDLQNTAVTFVDVLASLMIYTILAQVILSWVFLASQKRPGRLSMVLGDMTEPIFRIVKKLPHSIGMMDLSPLIALFGIDLLRYLLITLIMSV